MFPTDWSTARVEFFERQRERDGRDVLRIWIEFDDGAEEKVGLAVRYKLSSNALLTPSS